MNITEKLYPWVVSENIPSPSSEDWWPRVTTLGFKKNKDKNMRNYRNVVVVVEKGKQENNRNVLGVLVELKQ